MATASKVVDTAGKLAGTVASRGKPTAGTGSSAAAKPATAQPAAAPKASANPIAGYDDLTVAQVKQKLAGLTAR